MSEKFAVTTLFGMIYLFTSELYPTSVRAKGLSICSFSARVGSIVAPFTAELVKLFTFRYLFFKINKHISRIFCLQICKRCMKWLNCSKNYKSESNDKLKVCVSIPIMLYSLNPMQFPAAFADGTVSRVTTAHIWRALFNVVTWDSVTTRDSRQTLTTDDGGNQILTNSLLDEMVGQTFDSIIDFITTMT